MTQEEFNNHHREFISNYQTKYSTLNLNFDMVMKMVGVEGEEFKDKIKNIEPNTWVERRYDDSWDIESSGRVDGGEEYMDDEYDY